MLFICQVVQTFVCKLDHAWMVVEQTFTGAVTGGQVSEVEYNLHTHHSSIPQSMTVKKS